MYSEWMEIINIPETYERQSLIEKINRLNNIRHEHRSLLKYKALYLELLKICETNDNEETKYKNIENKLKTFKKI